MIEALDAWQLYKAGYDANAKSTSHKNGWLLNWKSSTIREKNVENPRKSLVQVLFYTHLLIPSKRGFQIFIPSIFLETHDLRYMRGLRKAVCQVMIVLLKFLDFDPK